MVSSAVRLANKRSGENGRRAHDFHRLEDSADPPPQDYSVDAGRGHITALEVAQALPLLLSMSKDPLNYWEDYIPEKLRRHFLIEDQK